MEGNQESEKETEAGQERQPSLEEMFARLDEILNNMIRIFHWKMRSLCMNRG